MMINKEQIIIRDSKRPGWQFIPSLNSRYIVDQKKGEKTMAYLKGY